MRVLARWMLFVLLGLAVLPVAAAEGWSSIDIKVNLPGRFSLMAGAELRHERAVFTRRYLHNWQTGLLFRLFKHVHVGLGYKREVLLNRQLDIEEDRFFFIAMWNPPLSKNIELDIRFLAERRRIEERLGQHHHRFRLRVRLLWRVAVWGIKLIPFADIEPFFETINKEVSQNRVSAGLSFPFYDTLKFTLAYLREDRKYHDIRHVFFSGLYIEL